KLVPPSANNCWPGEAHQEGCYTAFYRICPVATTRLVNEAPGVKQILVRGGADDQGAGFHDWRPAREGSIRASHPRVNSSMLSIRSGCASASLQRRMVSSHHAAFSASFSRRASAAALYAELRVG